MSSASWLTAFGIGYAIWFTFSAFIYVALVRQIAARRSTSTEPVTPGFGAPEAILAASLISLLLLNVAASLSSRPTELTDRNVIGSLLVTIAIVGAIIGLLKLRHRSVEALAGFSKIGTPRAIATGAILLLFAYPLIALADLIVRQFSGGASSKQSIIELFNSSQTISQRVIIIIFAVAIAPIAEEFIFRFFIYGILRRYFGFAFGLVANAFLFAAVHGHLPSFVALFVLGSCFTIAYEWSGSILVSMTMHSLFNALTLIFLAFPQLSEQ